MRLLPNITAISTKMIKQLYNKRLTVSGQHTNTVAPRFLEFYILI